MFPKALLLSPSAQAHCAGRSAHPPLPCPRLVPAVAFKPHLTSTWEKCCEFSPLIRCLLYTSQYLKCFTIGSRRPREGKKPRLAEFADFHGVNTASPALKPILNLRIVLAGLFIREPGAEIVDFSLCPGFRPQKARGTRQDLPITHTLISAGP